MLREKPGYPFQVLGFAHAKPVGFPLLSLAQNRLIIMALTISSFLF
jgi:hypothetical protein